MADDDYGVVQVRNSQGALVSTETRKTSQPKKVALDEDEFTDVSIYTTYIYCISLIPS